MTYNDELYHYGVLGMKWGKRRYTNSDGSLNALGKKRQAQKEAKAEYKKAKKDYKALASSGKSATGAVLAGIGGLTVGAAAGYAVGNYGPVARAMRIVDKAMKAT